MKRGAFCHKIRLHRPHLPKKKSSFLRGFLGCNIFFSPGAHPHLTTALLLLSRLKIIITSRLNRSKPSLAHSITTCYFKIIIDFLKQLLKSSTGGQMADFHIAKSPIHFAENHFLTMTKSQKSQKLFIILG